MMNKRFFSLCAALLLVLGAALPASAAGKLSVVEENFVVLPYLDCYAGFVYAQVENVGDKPVAFNGGLLELYDGEGNAVEASDWITCYPKVLEPGEKGYLSVYQKVDEAKEPSYISDYLLTVTGKGATDEKTLYFNAEGAYEVDEQKYWSRSYLACVIENPTDETYYDVDVVFAAKDAEGKLLYVTNTTPYNVGLMPGSKVKVRADMDSQFLEYIQNANVEIASVEAIAFTLVEK